MTQTNLAENVGVSLTYISSIERGILNALNVSADFVFCDVVNGSLKQKSCYNSAFTV